MKFVYRRIRTIYSKQEHGCLTSNGNPQYYTIVHTVSMILHGFDGVQKSPPINIRVKTKIKACYKKLETRKHNA